MPFEILLTLTFFCGVFSFIIMVECQSKTKRRLMFGGFVLLCIISMWAGLVNVEVEDFRVVDLQIIKDVDGNVIYGFYHKNKFINFHEQFKCTATPNTKVKIINYKKYNNLIFYPEMFRYEIQK